MDMENLTFFEVCYLFVNMFGEMKMVVNGVVGRNHGMAVQLSI
jgi:hypothetical protein